MEDLCVGVEYPTYILQFDGEKSTLSGYMFFSFIVKSPENGGHAGKVFCEYTKLATRAAAEGSKFLSFIALKVLKLSFSN
jgi:hypothetical protein